MNEPVAQGMRKRPNERADRRARRPTLAIRAHRRGRERGATVFVVALLITMLLGIGVFAARSSSLATATSGHARQMTQAQYLAEYGVLLARAEIDEARAAQAFRDLSRSRPMPSPCYGQSQLPDPRCVVYCYERAQAKLAGASQNLFETRSLGSLQTAGIFCVQLTDWTRSSIPQPGTAVGSLTPFGVTATSIAVIRNNATPDAIGYSTSTQMSRAYMTTVPIPP